LTLLHDANPRRDGFEPGIIHGVLLLMAIWLNGIAGGAISPVLPRIAQHFAGARNLDLLVGFVGTMPALAVAFLAIPIGSLADRIGQRPILLVGLLLYGGLGMLPLWLESLHGIVASRLVVGVGEAAVMTAGTGMLGLYFHGRTRERWLSAQVATANIMGVIFVFVGGLIGTQGWRAPFAIYILALLLFVPTFFLIREPSRPKAARMDPAPPMERAVLFPLARNMALTVLLASAIFVVIVQMSFLLAERGTTGSATIGTAISLAACGIALGATFAGLLTRVPARYRLGAALAGAAGGFLGLALVQSVPAMVMCGFIGGMGCGVGVATLLGATIAATPAPMLGRVSGAWTSAIFLGQFLNPPLFVIGRALFGSLPAAIVAFALLCAIAAAVVAFTPQRTVGQPTSSPRARG